MRGAVGFRDRVIEVVAAAAGGEREIRWAEVGAIEHDDLVIMKKLHVHGGDADVAEDAPLGGGGERRREEEEEEEEEGRVRRHGYRARQISERHGGAFLVGADKGLFALLELLVDSRNWTFKRDCQNAKRKD